MRLVVVQAEGNELIADVEDYEGPVPAVGQYLFHPPLDPTSDKYNGGTAGCVKSVAIAAYGRAPGTGPGHFVKRWGGVVVEVTI